MACERQHGNGWDMHHIVIEQYGGNTTVVKSLWEPSTFLKVLFSLLLRGLDAQPSLDA
jgi:hypothetical protein